MKSKYLAAFVDMTLRFALTSEAERLKVGACLISNGNPVCFGVNGTPSGWSSNTCESPTGDTLPEVIHAEINCLNKLRKLNVSTVDSTLLVTHSPCLRCAHEIVDAGIVSVIYLSDYRDDAGLRHLKDKGVTVYKYEEVE